MEQERRGFLAWMILSSEFRRNHPSIVELNQVSLMTNPSMCMASSPAFCPTCECSRYHSPARGILA